MSEWAGHGKNVRLGRLCPHAAHDDAVWNEGMRQVWVNVMAAECLQARRGAMMAMVMVMGGEQTTNHLTSVRQRGGYY